MGAIQPGDFVFDERGRPTRVVQTSGIMDHRPCYRVTFRDGESIVADAQHLWAVRKWQQSDDAPLTVLTTESMATTTTRSGRPIYAIPTNETLELPEADLALDPYTLGVWLGDGNTDIGYITSPDPEILNEIEQAGHPVSILPSAVGLDCPRYKVGGLTAALRFVGVLGNKYIPQDYLRASAEQRLALIQGLMDTDGHATARGQCEFSSTNHALAHGMAELLYTFGIKTVVHEGRATLYGKDCGPKYRVQFTTTLPVFRLSRKKARLQQTISKGCGRRYITKIERVQSVPVQCIQVEAASHLFLAGRSMVPTHNSQLMHNVGYNACVRQAKNVALVSLEMPVSQIRRRTYVRHTNHPNFGCPGGLPYKKIKEGSLNIDEEKILFAATEDFAANPAYGQFHVLQVGKQETVPALKERLMALRARGPIDLVIVDYASLMSGTRKRNSRQDEIVEVIEGLKALALTFNDGEGLAMLSANQISRGAKEEADKLGRYGINFASETSAIEKNSDLLGWILRNDELKANHEAKIGVSKYRDGATLTEFVVMEHFQSGLLADLDDDEAQIRF
jgi:replicative DNA helicase